MGFFFFYYHTKSTNQMLMNSNMKEIIKSVHSTVNTVNLEVQAGYSLVKKPYSVFIKDTIQTGSTYEGVTFG